MRRLITVACLLVIVAVTVACGRTDEPELTAVAAPVEAEAPGPAPAALSPTVADVGDVLTGTVSDLSDPTPVMVPAELLELPPRPLPPDLAALDDVDIESVLRRGCLMWSFTEFRDHGAINDAVNSFLSLGDRRPSGGTRMFTRAQLELVGTEGIRAACAADSVEHAWGILASVLDMSDEDFSILVGIACERYRFSEAQPAEFQPHNKTWDGFVLEALGVGDLTDLIDRMCGPAA